MPTDCQVYVIHVRGNAAREAYIRGELGKHGLDFEFMLDANLGDIDQRTLDAYFVGEMHQYSPAMSCTLKHLRVYERMVREGVPFGLIFEDDIALSDNFNAVFAQSLQEIVGRGLENVVVSYESTGFKYVNRSERKAGMLLYRQRHGRCAGAYLVDLAAARTMVEYVAAERCHVPIDWLHNAYADRALLSIYWCEPAIAEQLSHNGAFQSLIDSKGVGLWRRVSFALQRWYKRLRSELR